MNAETLGDILSSAAVLIIGITSILLGLAVRALDRRIHAIEQNASTNDGRSIKERVQEIESPVEREHRDYQSGHDLPGLLDSTQSVSRVTALESGVGDIERSPEVVTDSTHGPIVEPRGGE